MLLRWENDQRQRYYIVHVHVDLFDTPMVSCFWGGIGTRRGGQRHWVADSASGALAHVETIAKTRCKHGYRTA